MELSVDEVTLTELSKAGDPLHCVRRVLSSQLKAFREKTEAPCDRILPPDGFGTQDGSTALPYSFPVLPADFRPASSQYIQHISQFLKTLPLYAHNSPTSALESSE
jgi:hypothetical protein